MAYMGRGNIPTINGENFNNVQNLRTFYRFGFVRLYYYIPLDNTYVILQMIATIIIMITLAIAFITTYKPSVIDPIESTKNTIINTHIAFTLIFLIITLLTNHFSKDKNALIRRLAIVLATSIITIFVFMGIKANLDSTYTDSKFEQIYEQEYGQNNSSNKTKIDIGITGMKIKSEKEFYVDECKKAYNVFNIREYSIIGLNGLLVILLIYQILKVSKIQEKKDKLSKDDAILFDEEENIKF